MSVVSILIFLLFSSYIYPLVSNLVEQEEVDQKIFTLQELTPFSNIEDFTALFEGKYNDISADIKYDENGNRAKVTLVDDGNSNTEDNCYIVKLIPETPLEIQTLLVKYLNEYGDISTTITLSAIFKGIVICFPRELLESLLSIDMIRQIPWISFIEHDSILHVANTIKTKKPASWKYVKAQETEPVMVQHHAPWGLARISQPKRPLNERCYEYSNEGKDVNIYIIDSGLDDSHPEFEGRTEIVFNGPGLANEKDCSGHGTEVASVAAGRFSGVAKKANVKALKVLSCDGFGRNSDLIAALEWMANNFKKPGVLNLSLGGPKSTSLDLAIKALIELGIPIVVAAGNGNINACEYSPAHLSDLMTVGASNANNERAAFSNYGKCVNIFAPGDLIPVAQSKYTDAMMSGNKKPYIPHVASFSSDEDAGEFILSSGTSLAAPAVAGVVALILERHPDIPLKRLWSLIRVLAQKESLKPETLQGSPNLLLQSVPGIEVDLLKLEEENRSDDDYISKDPNDEGVSGTLLLSPMTWSWILISSLMILAILGVAAIMAGIRFIKKGRKYGIGGGLRMRSLSTEEVTRGRTLF